MDRNLQKIGLVNLAALLVLGGALAVISRQANSLSGQVGVAFLGLGFLVAAVSYFQARLLNKERLEKMEFDELNKGPASAALFTQEAETFPARRSREQFEKYFVPAFTVLLCLGQGAAGFFLLRWLRTATPLLAEQTTLAMALSSLFAMLFFLLGKYSAGIARIEGQHLLKPAASYLLLGAVVSVIAALSEAAHWFGFPTLDTIAARILSVVLILVGVETLITLILEIYRPRVRGQATRLLYDSRVIGLLGQPGGLITTAAQALDYQFGFKVSETWFYQFLEKALAWIVLLQLGVLFLSTTVVIIQPQEQGILERFGKPLAGKPILEPGLHFKFPWPMDKVYTFPTRELHTLYVGYTPSQNEAKEQVLVWTKPHYTNEFDMLVASRDPIVAGTTGEKTVPVNLLAVNIPIQYRVRDVQSWLCGHANATALLQSIADREVVRYLINVDSEHLMTSGRLKAAEELRSNIQKHADADGLGVEVLLVCMASVHPPVKVAKDFEEVIGARHEMATNILSAKAYQAATVPTATADADQLLTRAKNEALVEVSTAAAKAGQFTNQLAAWERLASGLSAAHLPGDAGALHRQRAQVRPLQLQQAGYHVAQS